MNQQIVKCPKCTRQLRVPPNADIFKCPCGQHLRAPRQTNAPAQMTLTRPTNTPTTTPTPNYNQYNYNQPPYTQNNYTPPAAPQNVRCPRCSTILAPPPGAPIFKCQCGITLRAPNAPAQNQVQYQPNYPPNNYQPPPNYQNMQPPPNVTTPPTNNNTSSLFPSRLTNFNMGNLNPFNRRGNGTSDNQNVVQEEPKKEAPSPGLGDMSTANVAAKSSEMWLRNLGAGDKLYWVRILSPEQEEKIGKLLSTWENDMKENIDDLEEYDLKVRLEQLGMNHKIESDQDAMRKTILGAKDHFLSENNSGKIIQLLNKLNVEHTACTSLTQYVERIMAAVWYGPTRLCDGMVRNFTSSLELNMIPAQSYGLALEYETHRIRADELEEISMASFTEKEAWFRKQCDKVKIPWEDGRVEMKIQRENLLQDSFYKLSRFEPRDFHKTFKFTFVTNGQDESGLDAGGLAREWFELITDRVFHVDFGLFEYSGVDNICYQFNPGSGIANELHEEYFRFIGRFIGKALFDKKFINAHLTQPIFKHILGYPISVEDIQYCDEQVYSGLKAMEEMESEEVDGMYLAFAHDYELFGETLTFELKEGGEEISVTKANLQEYIGLMTKYFMLERTKPQLANFLRGIYDVIPEVWLSVFDYRELELLLCGLPNIDVSDWKANTEYRGEYKAKGPNDQVIRWFWEYVEACNQEQRARILQFCTGTSRVPVAGFSALQGKEGTIQKFCLVAVPTSKFIYPRSHTCFNRLDLPMYKTKKELVKRLEEAFAMNLTGFSDE